MKSEGFVAGQGEGDEKAPTRKQSPNIKRDADGTLCWVYEYSFWKNPTILLTAWKVFLLACLLPAMIIFFSSLGDGLGEAAQTALMVYGIVAAVLTGLLILSYPLVALLYGGKYCVLFRMNDTGVDHIQLQKQYKKAQAIGFLAMLAGLAGGNPTVAGAGLLSATRQSMHTDFQKIKSVRIRRRRHTIHLNEALKRNQVYADAADFAFVKDYILSHCPETVRMRA